MKIAILSLYSRFGGVTGDCVQAAKTASALRELGETVDRLYLKPETEEIVDDSGLLLGRWTETMGDYDIIHTTPPIPSVYLPKSQIKARFATSTVFWRSVTYSNVVRRNIGKLTFGLVKEYVRLFLAWLGMPTYRSYLAYDLLLPNSIDEIDCFCRYCKVRKGARIVAVPNAIDPIPDSVQQLPRSARVPSDDYVLVPAYFAPRKNQGALIRALKDFPHPVVFIGEGPLLDRCKKIAGPNMTFLGHVAHGSEEFYAIMRDARVVCLPSNCETPGIAGLEAAALGARPVVPREGGTTQYYGWDAVYLDPLSETSIASSVEEAWRLGRLSVAQRGKYGDLNWPICAQKTLAAYKCCLQG